MHLRRRQAASRSCLPSPASLLASASRSSVDAPSVPRAGRRRQRCRFGQSRCLIAAHTVESAPKNRGEASARQATLFCDPQGSPTPQRGCRPTGRRGVSRFWFPPAPPSLRYAPRLTAWHGPHSHPFTTGRFVGGLASRCAAPSSPRWKTGTTASLRSLEGPFFLFLFFNVLWGGHPTRCVGG